MDEQAVGAWVTSGLHRNRFEAPDVFFTVCVGPVSRAEMQFGMDELRRAAGARRLFWMIDQSQTNVIHPEARKLMLNGLRELPIHGLVAFGLSFEARILMKLFLEAARVLHIAGVPVPIVAVENEAKARAWIDEQRAKLSGTPQHGGAR